jgi:hypothetical protein
VGLDSPRAARGARDQPVRDVIAHAREDHLIGDGPHPPMTIGELALGTARRALQTDVRWAPGDPRGERAGALSQHAGRQPGGQSGDERAAVPERERRAARRAIPRAVRRCGDALSTGGTVRAGASVRREKSGDLCGGARVREGAACEKRRRISAVDTLHTAHYKGASQASTPRGSSIELRGRGPDGRESNC